MNNIPYPYRIIKYLTMSKRAKEHTMINDFCLFSFGEENYIISYAWGDVYVVRTISFKNKEDLLAFKLKFDL